MCGICGICGIWGADSASAAGRLNTMLETMVHRGPEGRGNSTGPARPRDAQAGDHRPGGGRPAHPQRGRFSRVVFNGEIYNFRELRRPRAPGPPFRHPLRHGGARTWLQTGWHLPAVQNQPAANVRTNEPDLQIRLEPLPTLHGMVDL